MPELLELDLLWLDGHNPTTPAESMGPYKLIEGPDMAPGGRKYEWTESPYVTGATMIGEAPMNLVERTLPIRVYPRFSSALTNLLTNPRPYSVVTGWQAEGAGSTVTYNTVDSEAVIQAVTTGTANSGMEHSFTATAAAYSGGCWVKVSSGTAPMKVIFDGETGTSFTATTSWQFVKTENKTLTAATRYLQVLQTDTGSRTIYVKMAGAVLSATYPGYIDGAIGDAIWNGTAHASTSTARTSQDAINRAIGALAEKTEKAIAERGSGEGIPLYWTPSDATYGRTTTDCLAVDVSGAKYDHTHRVHNLADCEVKLTCHPYALGPEYTAGTGSKPAGRPALPINLTSVKGDGICPTRIVITGGSLQDQRFAAFGIQGRDYRSGTSLIIRGPDLTVTDYAGTVTAHTNEVQTLTPTGSITGGYYTVTLDGKTTSNLTAGTAAELDAALEALANVGSGNVVCAGGPITTTPITATFQGDLAGCNMSQMTEDDSNLTGGGTLAWSTTTAGVPGYVSAGLYSEYTTICDTGNLSLVGDYRVIARVYDNAATTDIYKSSVRLTWGLGDLASTTTNDSAVPQAVGDYSLVDLGHVQIPVVATGTQRFIGRIEGKTTGTAGNTLRIVDLMFVPMETGLGEVRTVDTNSGVRLVGHDPTFAAASGALNGDAAALGGNWTTTGDATDFQDGTDAVTRNEVSDAANTGRWAVLATSYTNIAVTIDVSTSAVASTIQGAIARYADTSNYLIGYLQWTSSTALSLVCKKRVAGSLTTLGSVSLPIPLMDGLTVSVNAFASGRWTVGLQLAGSAIYSLSGTDSALATGGALASGQSGFYDEATTATASTRTYTAFVSAVVPEPQAAIYASQDLQFRANGDVLREDSAGSGIYSTPAITTVPFLPRLTPAGAEGLTNRLLVMTSRYNPDLGSDPLPDAFDVTVYAKPAYSLARWET